MKALAFLGVGCGDSIALHSTPDASPSIDVAADVNVIAAQTICGQPEQTSAPPAITIATGIGSYPEVIIDSTIVEVFRAGDAAPIATTGVTQHASSTASFSVTVGTNGSPLVGYVRARLGYTYLDGYWFPQSPLAADVSAPDALQLVRRNSDHDFHYAGGPLEPNHSLVVPNYTDCNGKGVYGATVTVSPPVEVRYEDEHGAVTTIPTPTTYGGWFDAPPGFYTITVASPGTLWRTTTIEVQPNMWANVEIKPL